MTEVDLLALLIGEETHAVNHTSDIFVFLPFFLLKVVLHDSLPHLFLMLRPIPPLNLYDIRRY